MIDVKGKLQAVSRTFKGTQMLLTLKCDALPVESITQLENRDLRIKIGRWTNPRSLDSNKYMWVLTQKIAEALGSDSEFEHRRQMMVYAPADLDDNRYPHTIRISAREDINTFDGYYRYYDNGIDERGEPYVEWIRLRRSKDFNNIEMHNFLQRVIEEAEELGIQTATPDQIREMEALWERNRSKAESRKT